MILVRFLSLKFLLALAARMIGTSNSPHYRFPLQCGTSCLQWRRWEADERPEPRSLGLLPSGPDPVGEWLVHRQPPMPISVAAGRKASLVNFACCGDLIPWAKLTILPQRITILSARLGGPGAGAI